MCDEEKEGLGVDKMMKVITPEGTVVVINLAEIAQEITLASMKALRKSMDYFLPNNNSYSTEIGMPAGTELEENLRKYFDKLNKELFDRIRRSKLTSLEITSSKIITKLDIIAKELGIEPAKFDNLEWNKLALEISRKELEISAGGPTEVDPRKRDGQCVLKEEATKKLAPGEVEMH